MESSLLHKKQDAQETLERLAEKYGWRYDEQQIVNWEVGHDTRSLCLPIEQKDGSAAFFKYPMVTNARRTLRRERAYMEYIGQKYPGFVPKIYLFGSGTKPWMLREFSTPPEDLYRQTQKTQNIHQVHIRLLVEAIARIQGSGMRTSPVSLTRYRYAHPTGESLLSYTRRLKWYFSRIRNQKLLRELDFPLDEIGTYLSTLKRKDLKVLTDNSWIIHGDYSPNNLIFNQEKEALIVLDWEWATITHARLLYGGMDVSRMLHRLWANPTAREQFFNEVMDRKLVTIEEIQISLLRELIQHVHSLFMKLPQSKIKEDFGTPLQSTGPFLKAVLEL